MARKAKKPAKTCGECIHEYACQAWNIGGHLHDTDASSCINYETVRDSAAYYIGYKEGQRDAKREEV